MRSVRAVSTACGHGGSSGCSSQPRKQLIFGLNLLNATVSGTEPASFFEKRRIPAGKEAHHLHDLRVSFGAVFERVPVSPRSHRRHHSIGAGRGSIGPGTLGGQSFAVSFPVWDALFGTANFDRRFSPTGIRDQLPTGGARDHGRGFWSPR